MNKMLAEFEPFLLSVVIGMLIGIERERKLGQGTKSIGLRTFILISLCGTVAAKLEEPIISLSLSLFVFAIISISYLRATENQKEPGLIGITTEMAAGLVYVLGFMMFFHTVLAIGIGLALFFLLYGRNMLHAFATKKVRAKEIEASAIIMIISIAVLSFLPNRTIDPWKLFNPQEAGFIVLLLAGMQFAGYIAIRLFGSKLGMQFFGFFSGFISSTSLFITISAEEKNQQKIHYTHVLAGIFATIASLISLLIVVSAVNYQLLTLISLPFLATLGTGYLIAYYVEKKVVSDKTLDVHEKNPLDLIALIKNALMIISILFISSLSSVYFGYASLPIIALITGLVSTNGMAYAISVQYTQTSMSLNEASMLLIVTAFAGFLSKIIIVWLMAKGKFSWVMSAVLLGMVSAGALVYCIIFSYEQPIIEWVAKALS